MEISVKFRCVYLFVCTVGTVVLGLAPPAHGQIDVISVDITPLTSPGIDFNGNAFTTMGMALQAVDQGGEFNVTEVTPAAFRALTAGDLGTYDLIAILNATQRIDDGNLAGLGLAWHDAIGVEQGGRVLLCSHDPVRFHMNQLPGSGLFGAGFPGGPNEPFGAPNLVRQAALWAGGGSNTGLLMFNDAPAFAGGGWGNAVLNLPFQWGIVDSFQTDFGDGGYTDILPAFSAHPVYAGLSDVRFTPQSITSFSANLGDIAFHTVFGAFNAAIFTPTEVIVNAGVVDVGGTGCCTGSTIPGPDGTAITLIRNEMKGAIPTVSEWGVAIMALLLLIGAKVYFSRRRRIQAG